MIDEEGDFSEPSREKRMLNEAISALRVGNRAQARDLLTRLLKTDQKNSTYWVWLSAAVETQKERLYCLQKAIQADPQNAAAKRGLVILGGMPLDDSVQPFQLNRRRLWEELLINPQDSREKKHGWENPVVRLFIVLGIGLVIIGGLFIGKSWLLTEKATPLPVSTRTQRPTLTSTSTASFTPMFRTPTATFLGPTPLWMFLGSTYTPTPLYVMTQHPVISRSAFEAGLRFLAAKDYPNALVLFQQAISLEPDAADLLYYIGETYCGQGDYRSARDAYQETIDRYPTFAPAYLGRARADQGLNPAANILSDLNEAINLDPAFAEAYIARGAYMLDDNPTAAIADLETAIELTPESAMAYLVLAEAQLSLGENEAALQSAIHANELDMTLVPVYLVLGRVYMATGQTAQAVSVLQTYTIFSPDDPSAFLLQGSAYNSIGEYDAAVEALNNSIEADRRNPEAYFQRGMAYLNSDNPNKAEADFKTAINYDALDFDSALGLARAYFQQGKPGNAYLQAQQNATPLARVDGTKAQLYYWQAIFLEAIGDPTSKSGARNNWMKLIALPAEAMPEDWRNQAYQQLNVTPTFTATLTLTKSLTPTPTLLQTKTLTKTPTMVRTPTPTRTVTKTP
jgi:tetratricopeptide (TPR) repeat protein